MLKLVNVTLDDGMEDSWSTPGYIKEGYLWNGYEVPSFTLDTMREIAQRYPEMLRVTNGVVVYEDTESGYEPEEMQPRLMDVGGLEPVPLYTFDGWVWQRADA